MRNAVHIHLHRHLTGIVSPILEYLVLSVCQTARPVFAVIGLAVGIRVGSVLGPCCVVSLERTVVEASAAPFIRHHSTLSVLIGKLSKLGEVGKTFLVVVPAEVLGSPPVGHIALGS